MKAKSILFTLLTLLLGLASCSDDDKKSKEYVVTVASVETLKLSMDELPDSPYFVKYEGTEKWQSHEYIEDFEFVEGYEYVIRVRREYDKSMEDMADASLYRYVLVEEISKEIKDSKDIPDQGGWITIASKKTGDAKFPYYVRNTRKHEWEKAAPMKGFEYEEGFEYSVEVIATYNGLNALPRYTYEYKKTERKEQKDSVGLPN